MARSNKGDETIYRRILCLSAKQKPHRTAGRKVDTKFNSGETMNAYIGRLYHQVALVQGYNSILVVVDWLTKMVHFMPTTEKTLAKELARLFRDNIWKLHGLPENIISDRGPQFTAGLM